MEFGFYCLLFMISSSVYAAVPDYIRSNPKFVSAPSDGGRSGASNDNAVENRYIVYFEKSKVRNEAKAKVQLNNLLKNGEINQGEPPSDGGRSGAGFACSSGKTTISELIYPMMGYIVTCPSDSTLEKIMSDNKIKKIVEDSRVYATGKKGNRRRQHQGQRQGQTASPRLVGILTPYPIGPGDGEEQPGGPFMPPLYPCRGRRCKKQKRTTTRKPTTRKPTTRKHTTKRPTTVRQTTASSCSAMRHYTLSSKNNWGLDRINQASGNTLDRKFSVYGDGKGVDVFILDTGIRSDHVEFTGRIDKSAWRNYVDNSTDPEDDNIHGSHVAGIAAGSEYGVAKLATIIPIKVLDSFGDGYNSDVIAAVNKIIQLKKTRNRPTVINLSLGSPVNQAMDDEVKSAVENGIFVSVAAGNSDSNSSTGSPAREPTVCTVANVMADDNLYVDSSYGIGVDISAPGHNIRSATHYSNTSYGHLTGTSMSAPHVAGVAACYLSVHPSATVSQVEKYLIDGSWKGKIGNIASNKPGTPNRILRSNKCD